jgi:gamma-glutamylcyclotransferase (GGCT)/AIG2-like uncharacterized protein YtfP
VQDLADIGTFLQGLAGILLVLGGLFAWYRYKAAKRVESIKWLTEIGSRFYQFDKLGEVQRRRFEYDFFEAYAPAMEKWLVYPDRLDDGEKATLAEIDALLNFFELICHVSGKDLYLHSSDRDAAFQYWFDDVIGGSDKHVFLRLYLQFGFEGLRERVKIGPPVNMIAVYGTLLRDVAPRIRDPELKRRARGARQGLGRLLGDCRIRGRLVDLGEYPGLVPDSETTVRGELYELPFGGSGSQELRSFRAAIAAIDEFEDVNPDNAATGEYVRRYVELDFPEKWSAWVYVLNRPPPQGKAVDSNDWQKAYEAKLSAE